MSQQFRIGTWATTVACDSEGVLRVTYHHTPIVTLWPNGKIVLDTGGYRSVTTETRMNQASHEFRLGFTVWQKDSSWYVDVDGHTIPFEDRELTIRNGVEK